MTEKDNTDSFRSRVVATPRSSARNPASHAPTPSGGEDHGGAAPIGPSPKMDTLGKKMLKHAMFPNRAPPAKIGEFTVLKELGAGGMGVVYACYDDQLDRKIAVKVLRGEMLRSQEMARARLVREAQAMARLSHPNIVTVHEVGQSEEQVFVAMEFVRGTTLEAWVAEPRPWRAVLDACLQAGRGLAAAHQAGLVHRDFKPQNVMVTEDGLVKVLDFGLARASDDNMREEFLVTQEDGADANFLLRPLTRTGTLLGTPAYMSAEQHRGEVATAASDQWSFCVTVYQCLYGTLPFSVRSMEALRGDVLVGRVATVPMRTQVPMYLYKSLCRGMAAKPDERFPSMTELLAALSRDPTAVYQRVGAMVAVAGLTGAVSFAAASAGSAELEICPDAHAELAGIWDTTRLSGVREALQALASPAADEALTIAEPRLAGYAEAWVAMRNEACLAHAEGRQSEQLFDLRTSCLDQRRAGFDALVGAFTTADSKDLGGLIKAVTEMPPLAACGDAQALTAALPPPEDPMTRVQVQQAREGLARAETLKHAGKFAAGLQIVEEILPEAMTTKYEPLLIETLVQKGDLQMEQGDRAAAITSFWSALWPAIRVGYDTGAAEASSKLAFLHSMNGDMTTTEHLLPWASALNQRVEKDVDRYSEWLNNRGWVHHMFGERDEARQLWAESLELRERHGRARTWRALDTKMNLADIADAGGDYEGALEMYQQLLVLGTEILGENHPRRLYYEMMMAGPLRLLGRPTEALLRLQRAVRNGSLIESSREHIWCLFLMGRAEQDLGDTRSARRHMSEALERVAREDGFRFVLFAYLMKASALDGDPEAMEMYHKSALTWIDENPTVSKFDLTILRRYHGQALIALGRTHEALAILEPLEGTMKETSALGWSEADVAMDIGEARRKQGDLDAAEQDFKRALTYFEANVPERSPLRAEALRNLGEIALQQGRFADAEPRLLRAEAIYAAVAEPNYAPLARTRFALAQVLTAAGPTVPAAARDYMTRALEAQRANGREEEVRAMESWLAEHP